MAKAKLIQKTIQFVFNYEREGTENLRIVTRQMPVYVAAECEYDMDMDTANPDAYEASLVSVVWNGIDIFPFLDFTDQGYELLKAAEKEMRRLMMAEFESAKITYADAVIVNALKGAA